MQPHASLRQQVEEFFDFAVAESRPYRDLRELNSLLESRRSMIHQPMRVAFVGKTNAGKSTMLNAFLGQEMAATGNGELTFNVTWLRYGERNRLLVRTIDGAAAEESFDSLAQLSARCEERKDLLEKIRFIEVQCPNPLLKTFDLIDTPGLHSFYEKDSRNTQQLLTDPETRPHAVVFLYSGALQEPDVRELERFHRSCGSLMSGLTAIGVLTKVDEWPNPFEDGFRSIRQLQDQHPETRQYFYAILPVVGPAGFGAQTLTVDEQAALASMSRLPEAQRRKLTRDVGLFCSREYPDELDIPPAAVRKGVFERLGRYGIQEALKLLGGDYDTARLSHDLLRSSNVGELRRIVTAHFGSRAFLIKVRSAFGPLRDLAFHLGESLTGAAAEVSRRIASRVDRITADDLRFREFALLELFYRGGLGIDESEIHQLLEVTGENGPSCWQRLGAAHDTPIEDLLQIAAQRQRQWRERAYEPFVSLEIEDLARVLAESYAEIHLRLQDAATHLEAAAAMLAYEL